MRKTFAITTDESGARQRDWISHLIAVRFADREIADDGLENLKHSLLRQLYRRNYYFYLLHLLLCPF